jgi:hypothetical protein
MMKNRNLHHANNLQLLSMKHIKIIQYILLVLIFAFPAFGKLELDSVHFDPAIISAGDEVDIVVQYHDEISAYDNWKDYEVKPVFKVTLESDDDLTNKYVTIQDSVGNNLGSKLISGIVYNKVFRVKVHQNAPAGNYEFKLSGIWLLNGEPIDTFKYVRLKMPVKKEGIILDITTIQTVPSEVRPGDNFVKINSYIENVGEKDAKEVVINLNLPHVLESSYSNNNRVWVGRVNAGESKEVTFFIDVDKKGSEGIHQIKYNIDYMDLDNNKYTKISELPFLIKSRPYLEIVKFKGEGLAGTNGKLYVTIKNTGSESAESVDARIIKQNSQPFAIDVRSDYIGELEPNEEATAIFNIAINRDAEIKEHDLKLIIRSKGDTDEGDDNIYTYNRRAKFTVSGVAPNKFLYVGIIGIVIVILFLVITKIAGAKKK